MDSILISVKKQLGIAPEDTSFDDEIVIHTNSVFSLLTQLGVGPADGFRISDADAVWGDYLGDVGTVEMVKSYMFMKVRLIFDPPQSSAGRESLEALAKEFEWRINVAVDTKMEEEDDG